MDYPQILCKTFLKLKVTTLKLVMRHRFPQEILKQLDMDHRPSPIWLQKFGTLYLNKLKAEIKIWKLENCPCRLCGTYLP